jgi:hypothetical protein
MDQLTLPNAPLEEATPTPTSSLLLAKEGHYYGMLTMLGKGHLFTVLSSSTLASHIHSHTQFKLKYPSFLVIIKCLLFSKKIERHRRVSNIVS